MGGSRRAPSGADERTRAFSASLLLHRRKWLCGAVTLGEWSMTIAIQQAPRVKYFQSFTGKK